MKDKTDMQTVDFVGGRGKPGRKRQYATAAERQKAYRERQKAKGMIERRRTCWTREIAAEQPIISSVLVIDTGIGAVARALRDRG